MRTSAGSIVVMHSGSAHLRSVHGRHATSSRVRSSTQLVEIAGVTKFGTHLLPPIVGRGVLLDVAAHRGVARLPKGSPINREEIEAIAAKNGTEIGAGDIVLLHTGWGALAEEDPVEFMTGEPGLGLDGAEYLAEKNVTAVGADGRS